MEAEVYIRARKVFLEDGVQEVSTFHNDPGELRVPICELR